MTAAGRVLPRQQYEKDRAAIMRLASAFKLTRAHRLEVAEVLLNRNVSSYSDLSHVEMRRVRDAFEGAALICTIQIERKQGLRV